MASGWIGIIFWKTLAWLANPCYFAALICVMHWGRGAKITFSSLALFFALLTLELFSRAGLSDDRFGQVMLGRLGAGFYFWMISILILFYAALADTKTGDAFFQYTFQYTLPRIRLFDWSFPSAMIVALLLSLPAITVGGWHLNKSYVSLPQYQESRRNHPVEIDYAATRVEFK